MNNELNYFRIKTEYVREESDGSLSKVKSEDIVLAVNYTDAEKTAYAISEHFERNKWAENGYPINIEITKTKINELLFNDNLSTESTMINGLVCCVFEEPENTGVGMYAVKVMFTYEDDHGKEKKSNEIFYTPASSNTNAAKFVSTFLSNLGETRDFVIRDVKFDKAESVLWPLETYKEKTLQFDKYR